jgi:hypothetical protein
MTNLPGRAIRYVLWRTLIGLFSGSSCLLASPSSPASADTLVGYFNGFGYDSYGLNGTYRIGRAISIDNGVHWEQNPAIPLIGDGGLMQEEFAHSPHVIHLTSNSAGELYICYYRRWRSNNDDLIGIAVSSDGIHFSPYNASLVKTDVSWRERGVAFPYVILDTLETDPSKRFKMLYSGWSGTDTKYRVKIGLAFSPNGLEWTVPQSDTISIEAPANSAPLGFYNGFCYVDSTRTYHLFVEAARQPAFVLDASQQGGEEVSTIWHLVSTDFVRWKPFINRSVLRPDRIEAKLLAPLQPGDSYALVRSNRLFADETPLRWIESAAGLDPTYGLRAYGKVEETIVYDDSTQLVLFSPPLPFRVDTSLSVKSVIADRLYPSDYLNDGGQLRVYAVGFDNDNLFETMVLATSNTSGTLTLSRDNYPILPLGTNKARDLSDYWTGMSAENLRIMRTYHVDSLSTPTAPVAVSLPDDYRLYPAFPNPFNPSTTVRYALPTSATVRVQLYNVLGQLVSDLGNGVQEAGEHEIVVNVSGIPSGVLFLVARLGDRDFTQKLVLVK